MSSSQCEYKFFNHDQCPELTYDNSNLCILHLKLPNKDDPEFETIKEAKINRTQAKVDAGDFNFDGAQLVEFSAEERELKNANFLHATVSGYASFSNSTFVGYALFLDATFSGNVAFFDATFSCSADFLLATFSGESWFEGTTFNGASFRYATFSSDTSFNGTTFNGDADFDHAFFYYDASFGGAKFLGELSADGAMFGEAYTQETLCRIAKRNCEERGDKDEADNYHYREMEAKRKQKGDIQRYNTRLHQWISGLIRRYGGWLPFQVVLGYGVKPLRTFGIWLGVVVAFWVFYWWFHALNNVDSPFAYLYFSVMTAITPGYGRFDIKSEMYIFASIEAIFGAFMWIAIITILARKYFRS